MWKLCTFLTDSACNRVNSILWLKSNTSWKTSTSLGKLGNFQKLVCMKKLRVLNRRSSHTCSIPKQERRSRPTRRAIWVWFWKRLLSSSAVSPTFPEKTTQELEVTSLVGANKALRYSTHLSRPGNLQLTTGKPDETMKGSKLIMRRMIQMPLTSWQVLDWSHLRLLEWLDDL